MFLQNYVAKIHTSCSVLAGLHMLLSGAAGDKACNIRRVA